jgi:hypothetical protein
VQRSAFGVRRAQRSAEKHRTEVTEATEEEMGGPTSSDLLPPLQRSAFSVRRLALSVWLLARAVRVAIEPVRQLLFLDEASDLGP